MRGLSVPDSGCRAAECRLMMDSEFYLRLLRSDHLGGREYSREEVAVDVQGGVVSDWERPKRKERRYLAKVT
jgi:hypothetical protein